MGLVHESQPTSPNRGGQAPAGRTVFDECWVKTQEPDAGSPPAAKPTTFAHYFPRFAFVSLSAGWRMNESLTDENIGTPRPRCVVRFKPAGGAINYILLTLVRPRQQFCGRALWLEAP